MADHNLIDDPLVSFDQQPSSPTTKVVKTTDSYENRLLDDIDPFGSHNGANGNGNVNTNEFSLNNDLFPVDPREAETGRIFEKKKKSFDRSIAFVLERLHEFSTRQNEESDDSPFNTQSQLNGSVADKNTLLLDLDPEAPPPVESTNSETSSLNDSHPRQTNTGTLLDFDSATVDANVQDSASDSKSSHADENLFSYPHSNEQERQLLNQAYEEVDHAAQELANKLDLVTSPPATPDRQVSAEENQSTTPAKLDSTLPTASPAKKPAASTIKPTSATKPKPTTTVAAASKTTEPKSTASAASKSTEPKAAASTTKSTDPKPSTTTTRKTIHSAPTAAASASSKPKVTPTSPSHDASAVAKPTVDMINSLEILILEISLFFSLARCYSEIIDNDGSGCKTKASS